MIGASFDVEITDTCNPEEIVLKYDIKEGYTENTLNKFSSLEEFQGIKRLNVFRFDEDEGMLLPVETEFDVENSKLCAAVNETGTYCLMDMEIWLDNLDVEMPAENNVPAPKPAPKNDPDTNSEWEPDHVNNPIDIVFLLQTSGRDEHNYKVEKEEILPFCEAVYSKYKDIRIFVVGFGVSHAELIQSSLPYYTNFSDFKKAIDSISYDYTKNTCSISYPIRLLVEKDLLREKADRFVYLTINSDYDSSGIYDQWSIKGHNIGIFSQIDPQAYWYDPDERADYIQRIEGNGGLYTNIYYNETRFELLDHLENNLSSPRPVYDIYLPTKLKKIVLDGELTPNGTTNSDTDSLTDWEEIDEEKIKVNSDNSIELPVFYMADLVGHLTKFNQNGDYNFLVNDFYPRYYLPILSDPTNEDTDDDGLNDDVDEFPKQNFTINLNNCIEKIQNIEKYLKDYLSEIGQDRNDYMDYCMFLIRTQAPKYTGFKWFLTTGHTYVDDKFVKYLNVMDKTCLEYFQKMDAHPVYDVYGNKIDFLHLIATLAGQYNRSARLFIDEDLSGWLGDLQSFIYDLKKNTYGTNKDLKESALKLIATDETNFDSTDMFADIDAKNISYIYNSSGLLSHTLEDYYLKYTSKRFNLFIENSGGIDDIKKKAPKYTSQSLNPSHQFLTSNADAVTNKEKLFDIYYNNYVIDEHGNKNYTLNLPNIVSKEESDALVYAFVTYIQNGKEKENES